MVEEISDSRLRLAKFKNVKMLRTGAQSQPTTSPTKSVPTAPGSSGAASGSFSKATSIPSDGTQTIAVAKAAFGPRRSPVAIVAGAVAVVAAAAIAFIVGSHETP